MFTYYLCLGEGGVYVLFMFRGSGCLRIIFVQREGVFTHYLCLGGRGVYLLFMFRGKGCLLIIYV